MLTQMFERMFTKMLTMVSILIIFICAMNIILPKEYSYFQRKKKTTYLLITREAMFPGGLEASPWPWKTKTL